MIETNKRISASSVLQFGFSLSVHEPSQQAAG